MAGGEPMDGKRATTYPEWSPDAVTGREHAPSGFHLPGRGPKERLIVGPEGATVRLSASERLTVRYADCVACIHLEPESRMLLGRDGHRVVVRAEAWKDGAAAVAAIDAAVPPELVACDEHAPGALASPAPAT
jgi:hypothetical protein